MPTPSGDLSPDTLERLVGRAAELDQLDAERVSLAQAREIALELGISASAWDAAVAERLQRTSGSGTARRLRTGWVSLLSGGGGFAAGALGGWLNGAFNGNADVAFGALLVLGGVMLVTGAERAGRSGQVNLAAWWLSIPAGMMVAMKELLTDPLWFAAVAWLGTASFLWALPRVLRRVRASPGPTLAVTT